MAQKCQGELNEQNDDDDAEQNGSGKDKSFAVYLVNDGSIVIDKTLYEFHIADVGMMENVDDVAHEKGNEAQNNIPERVVYDSQCERQRFYDKQAKPYKWQQHDSGGDVAPTSRHQTEDGIYVVSVHPMRDFRHHFVRPSVPYPLSSHFSFA